MCTVDEIKSKIVRRKFHFKKLEQDSLLRETTEILGYQLLQCAFVLKRYFYKSIIRTGKVEEWYTKFFNPFDVIVKINSIYTHFVQQEKTLNLIRAASGSDLKLTSQIFFRELLMTMNTARS